MGFQILGPDKKPIGINFLDKEAAYFWNRELDSKWYVTPADNSSNWFDTIGWIIHRSNCETWQQVKDGLKGMMGESCKDGKEFDSCLEYLKPYFSLIDYWKAKGYEPKPVK